MKALRLACEGEGEMVAADGRLVVESGPVGQAKRQFYVRCEIPKRPDRVGQLFPGHLAR